MDFKAITIVNTYLILVSVRIFVNGDSSNSTKYKIKRQLYREQLLPQKGGKIPDSAFHVDRLAANRLNKEGISVPDGVLLEQRHHESHYKQHRYDPDIERSIIKLKQTPDGRYTPVEGRYPSYENEIHSTYIIRSPFDENYNFVLPPFNPNLYLSNVLQLPSKLTHNQLLSEKTHLIFQNHNFNYNRNQQIRDRLNHNFLHETEQPPRYAEWSMWSNLFPELFQQTIGYDNERNKGYIADLPSLTEIPITSFICDNSGKMYPDPEAKCQAFHLCHYNGKKETFLCPPATRFNPLTNECNPWYKTQCLPFRT